MKIDLSLATVEWLREFKAKEVARISHSPYRNLTEDLATAQHRYLSEELDLYIQHTSVSDTVIIKVSRSLSRQDLSNILAADIALPDGREIKFSSLCGTEIWYQYDETPSQALEITFS